MKTEHAENSYPLSPLQQGMLFHSLDARQAGVDIEQVLCRLHEDVDTPGLERAWRRVVERHAVLRTSFQWAGLPEPCQTVQPQVRLHFEEKDWRGLSAPERKNRLDRYLHADRRRGFNLAVAPLMRLALIRAADAEYWLVWTFHHILLDSRAISLVLKDLFAFYEAAAAGQEPELGSSPSYRDHIDWLQRQDPARDADFWRATLQGFLTPTPFTVDRCGRASARGDALHGEHEITLSESTTGALRAVAARHHATLNTVMQGAWALLLSRYSGEEDVVFGAVRACRRSPVAGAESIVGLLINTVPVRVRICPTARIGAWLEELRAKWVALRDHEHTPLARIQAWGEAPRGRPLFESLLNFQDPAWEDALRAQGGAWATREFSIRNQPTYPLAIDASGGRALRIKILYAQHRFDDSTIVRLLSHLRALLEGIGGHPDQPLSALQLMTPAERRQILVGWNQTQVDFPQDKLVPELFEEQAAKRPEALAVASGIRQLSYRELDQQAGRLARKLEAMGVGPERLVGVCAERSLDLVVAWLAVLKAGGAYLPLDPAYPDDRLAFLIADAKPVALLTQRKLAPRLASEPVPVLFLDDDTRDTSSAAEPASAPASSRRAMLADLAYVIYTSGSTGVPKGVEITHGSLLNLVQWHQRTYRVTPADRATQVAGPAFDAAVWELWPYLTSGASIHIPDEETRVTPGKLLAWLAEQGITLSFLPTPLAEAVLNEPWPENARLRALLTGGEKLHRRPPEHLPCCLLNHYGPTESTVVTTWTPVAPGEDADGSAPPIGRPIANTRVILLDRYLQPVPVGVPGELHIGGVGLARGYRNRPELTAEKFIPDPFASEPGARVYRTGDLARFRADGNLEFLGRLDGQVKIRGHRVELGEIETVLRQHESVREAAVVVCDDAPGEARLVAYVVPAPGVHPAGGNLREFLKLKLPDHMVPVAFVFLDALPLTPNGKLDRQSLPAAEPEPERRETFVEPRTPVEIALAEIWAEVLRVERVGVHDNFFDLGGHSLLATQVFSRVRSALAVDLLLQDLFESPTLAALAQRIEAVQRQSTASLPTTPQPTARHGTVPLSFAQERLWFLEQLEPGQPFNNIPAVVRLEGRLDLPALQQSLTDVLRRHDALRTTFTNLRGQPAATVESPRAVALPLVDLSYLAGPALEAEARRLAIEEARRPFDLAQSPLLRAQLLRCAPEDHWLLLTMHHIASDGWSMGVFYRELAALYSARREGRPGPLPDLPISYADFAAEQRQSLNGGALGPQLAFWKRQLGGRLPTLDLSTDRPRPATQTYRGAVHRFVLPKSISAVLPALSRRENVTRFMLLLAAFKALLHRYTGQEDILVGSPTAGRTRVETEGLIGFFLNTLVLRTDLSGDPPFRELLQRVRRAALDAYAYQDVPLEKLVDELQPQRDLSRSPLFQTMFILQNMPLHPQELPGLKLTPMPIDSGTAKFDLTLSMEETAGGLAGAVEYSTDLFEATTIARMAGHFETLLAGVIADPSQPVGRLPLLTEAERRQLLVQWNDTRAAYPQDTCLHQLIEQQARRTPDATALVCGPSGLTYRQLNHRANSLAHRLRALGVGPDALVGLCLERSLDLVVGLLGILKAGGAYVPLDPAYPRQRLAFMLEDSGAAVVLTQERLAAALPVGAAKVLCLDLEEGAAAPEGEGAVPDEDLEPAPDSGVRAEHLAYVIYTSGSTGQPKGVMVSHRNVVNFFAGMDKELGTEPGVWLAVTSVSFDISVLELFWTLARGFKVVIQPDEGVAMTTRAAKPVGRPADVRKMEFSLFYFSSDEETRDRDKYRLLIEGAKFADRHNFAAVWTPERHFHAFGGLYPNAAVTSATLAMVTRQIQIRAGSVVLPLHHPVRVAEEWAVVDNLSNGRVGISFASGWHDRDFVLAPDNYQRRRESMFQEIETVRRLWRGEALSYRGGSAAVEVKIFPRPIQRELPIWITASGSPETFRRAGEIGANLLTHLLGQTPAELADKIRIYREARAQHGHPGEGRVTLMLHTFVGDNLDTVRETVRRPFCEYLKSSLDLVRGLDQDLVRDADLKNFSPADLDALVEHAFDRYFERCGLFGTPATCLRMIERLEALGVNEVACLIDFGVDVETVIASFARLNELRKRSGRRPDASGQRFSLPEEIVRHGVSHVQCTPSLARTSLLAPESLEAMRSLRTLLLGGEALPSPLAAQLADRVALRNMYGPTETTVWSATHAVRSTTGPIPIGRPIANTRIYILDRHRQPVPVGIAGELFIGGAGVARGYLNRPELTAEKFVPDSFHNEPDARLYRTGDRARYRSDGEIEFLGRMDHQVKIRGHRVEPGEIEAALARHPEVRQAVVTAGAEPSGDPRLVAYVVPATGTVPTTSELRRFLQGQLPESMVPAAFVLLDAVPLTPNGKVDRRALPEPSGDRPALESAYCAPRTHLEKTLADLWREVLGVERVGLHDNFFDLGGHSLLVVQLQARLREVLGRNVPVVQLFQFPTIDSLAQALSREPRESLSLRNITDRVRRQKAAFARNHKQAKEILA